MKGGSPKSDGWKFASEDTTLKVKVTETKLSEDTTLKVQVTETSLNQNLPFLIFESLPDNI